MAEEFDNEADAKQLIEHEGSPFKLVRANGAYNIKRGREILGSGKSIRAVCMAVLRAHGEDVVVDPALFLLAAAVSVDSEFVEAATAALYAEDDEDDEDDEDGYDGEGDEADEDDMTERA